MMDDLRVGDRVELVGEVELIEHGLVKVRFSSEPSLLALSTVLAGRRVARPLAIGDRVKMRNAKTEALFIDAISRDGSRIMLRDSAGGFAALVSPSDLERAPAPDTKGHQAGCACECCGGGRDQP